MDTRDSPDMYALRPATLGLWAYISIKSLLHMLQLHITKQELFSTTIFYNLLKYTHTILMCHVSYNQSKFLQNMPLQMLLLSSSYDTTYSTKPIPKQPIWFDVMCI